jgi:hypothetical protein
VAGCCECGDEPSGSCATELVRWYGHVKRMSGNRLPQKILEWEPEGTRRRGRPKERWIDGVRRSMTNNGLTEEDTRDRDMAKLSFG